MTNVSITDGPASRGGRRLPAMRAFDGIRGFIEMAGAAIRVASAVDERRRPGANDLAILGIKPSALDYVR